MRPTNYEQAEIFCRSHHVDSTACFFAKYHLVCSLVFANASFVRTNFHPFDFLSIRFVFRECICDDFLFTEMSPDVDF